MPLSYGICLTRPGRAGFSNLTIRKRPTVKALAQTRNKKIGNTAGGMCIAENLASCNGDTSYPHSKGGFAEGQGGA
jgi:hypothetical protein